MSEADRLNANFGSSKKSEAQNDRVEPTLCPVPLPAGDADAAGWETVNFPGAMSVDAIPPATARNPDAAAQIQMAMAIADDLAALVERLRAENADLKRQVAAAESNALATTAVPDPAIAEFQEQFQAQIQAQLHTQQAENETLKQQITQLESDLSQAQIAVQLETARNTHSDPADAVQALGVAQAQLDRLFQELELSHQANQRQQILVETLTEQLDGSQERIAQLERDCAVTQQRFNEQVQQRLQAESACRDLRMRLHRQQQQTLQLKAALEKSLEMTPPFRPLPSEEAEGDRPAIDPPAEITDPLAARNQPVKPWAGTPLKFGSPSDPRPATPFARLLETDGSKSAAPPSDTPERLSAVSEVTPMTDAIVPEPIVPEPIVSEAPASIVAEVSEPTPQAASSAQSSLPQRLGDLLNQMFPAAAPAAPAPERLQSEAAPAIDTTGPIFDIGLFLAADEAAQAAAIDATSAAATSDDLWQDLEQVIAPETPAQKVSTPGVPTTTQAVAPVPVETGALLTEGVSSADSQTDQPLPSSAATADAALNFFRLAGAQPPANRAAVPTNPLFTDGSSPSPILYPSRQPKKRQSLAAVELPRFPRKA